MITVTEIPEEAMARMVSGIGLAPGTLRDQLGLEPTLLIFLRHFGCIFCKEAISDLRSVAESEPGYPSVLFFTQGSPTESRAFLRNYWPSARAVSDPELWFYEAMGIRRASYLEALGPSVFRARSRAVSKGHGFGPRDGDIWRMPGALVVAGGQVLWRFDPAHAADHPRFAEVPSYIAEATGQRE